MKKKVLALGLAAVCALSMVGCGGSSAKEYNDGTYEGQSSVFKNDDGSEDGNGYGVVNITVKDNQIVECTFKTYEPDGTLKDEEYGKEGGVIANRDYFNKAQKAVAACDEYASLITQSGSLEGIDAISGATVNYNSFKEAVENALEQAEKK